MSGKFLKGNIVRIYMKNFLTYDEIELSPKPHLNVILGPNGTGKSSILCAICLVLAGKPEVTGRGKQVKEYIQYGKEYAIIEIELHNEHKNTIIRRLLTLTKKSPGDTEWYLQGSPCKECNIKDAVHVLGIKINNLCTFLPQDRVSEFARMNKVQLLESTELAVGCDNMAQQHEVLRNYGKGINGLQDNLKNLEDRLSQNVATNEKLEDQVANINKRDDIEKDIKGLTLSILCNKYNTAFKEQRALKDIVSSAKSDLLLLEERMKPYETKQTELINLIQLEKQHHEKQSSKVYQYKNELIGVQKKLNNVEEEIELFKEEYKQAEDNHRIVAQEILNLRKQVEVIRGQIRNLNTIDEANVEQEIKIINDQITCKCEELSKIQDSKQHCYEINTLKQQKQRLIEELSNSQNIKLQRLNILLSQRSKIGNQCKEIYEATKWITDKKVSGLFKGDVHNPIFSTLDIKNMEIAPYIENAISKRDLIAFVCEDRRDVQTIKSYADKMKWTVNVVHSDDTDPLCRKYTPNYKIEYLRNNFGFENYLLNEVKGPAAILTYLCKNFNFHKIPVSRRVINKSKVPQDLNRFYVGSELCVQKRSKYDGQVAQNISQIDKHPNFLSIADNTEKVQNTHIEIQDLHIRIQDLEETHKKGEERKHLIDMELTELREQKNSKRELKHQRKTFELNLKDKQKSLEWRESNVINLSDSKEKMNSNIQETIVNMLERITSAFNLEKKISDVIQSLISKRFTSAELQISLNKLNKQMESDKQTYEETEIDFRNKEETHQAVYKRSSILLKEITNILKISNKELSGQLKRELAHRARGSLVEMEFSLAEKETIRDTIFSADDGIVEEYGKRQGTIKKLQKDIDEILATMENKKQLIESAKVEWLPQITNLIEQINKRFSAFMAELNCAGEVLLDSGNDQNDFTQYGLSIKVKFRDEQILRELTAHQQSGGERSVSTALYLLSLQTLTAVPFRCVDEINQGMDPSNERSMFKMLVGSTTGRNASQYFLVTPKLLPNLPHNNRVNFMNVYNSTTIEKAKYFNLDKTLVQLKKWHSQKKH